MARHYRATVREVREVTYIVEAENKEEAEKKFEDRNATEIDWQQADFIEVSEIECISTVEFNYDLSAAKYGYNWRTYSSTSN